jgi:hypothetical protein
MDRKCLKRSWQDEGCPAWARLDALFNALDRAHHSGGAKTDSRQTTRGWGRPTSCESGRLIMADSGNETGKK